jgi:hypothetical protein
MNNMDAEVARIDSNPAVDAMPTASRRRTPRVRVTTAAAVALGLAVFGGGAVAGAASTTTPSSGLTSTSSQTGRPPMPFGGSPPSAVGKVSSVGDGTFTITTSDGTAVTVDVTATTTYRDPGVSTPTLADVTVGDHVAVFGTESSDTVSAISVAIGNPPAGGKGGPPGGPGGGGKGPGGAPPTKPAGGAPPPTGARGSTSS